VASAKRVVLGVVAGTVGVAASAVAGIAVSMPAGVHGAGATLAELQGHTRTVDYATADRAPRDLVPGWTRDTGTSVTVVRPGDASGDDSGSVRVDMTVADTELPAGCTPREQVGMPFDGGGSWPDLGTASQLCDGWVTVVLGDHLYAWTAADVPTAR
jgi:hypothetical protein